MSEDKFVAREKVEGGWSSPEMSVDAWDQWATEPRLWFMRFRTYCEMGPKRTITGAYKLSKEMEEDDEGYPILTAKAPGQAWWRMSREWSWRARAQKFDLANLDDWRQNYADVLALIRTESIELSIDVRRNVDELLGKILDRINEIVDDDDNDLTLSESIKVLKALQGMRTEMEKSLRLWMGESTEITETNLAGKLADSIRKTVDRAYGDEDDEPEDEDE